MLNAIKFIIFRDDKPNVVLSGLSQYKKSIIDQRTDNSTDIDALMCKEYLLLSLLYFIELALRLTRDSVLLISFLLFL